MEKKEILEKVIEHYANGNKSEFARLVGLTPQAITAWLRRNTFDVELLVTKCINLNPRWLMSGDGEMFTSNAEVSATEPTQSDCLGNILRAMQQEVAENNKFMRDQMKSMQDLLAEATQILKKSQEYYERALELHSQSEELPSVHPYTNYLAEPSFKKTYGDKTLN